MQLRSERGDKPVHLHGDLLALPPRAADLTDDLGQGNQVGRGRCSRWPVPFRAVREFRYPVHDANSQGFLTFRTDSRMAHSLGGQQPDSALAMPIGVVTAAFGKEVQRPGKPLACTQRAQHRKVVHRCAERSCLPAEHRRRMRIGVAHKPVVVKPGANPVHRWVRGESRLHGEDMFG